MKCQLRRNIGSPLRHRREGHTDTSTDGAIHRDRRNSPVYRIIIPYMRRNVKIFTTYLRGIAAKRERIWTTTQSLINNAHLLINGHDSMADSKGEQTVGASQFQARPLHLHTLDSLIADLVSGRGVMTGSDNLFTLPDENTRAALDWYRKKGPSAWAANVIGTLCDDLVDAVFETPPELPFLPARPANAGARRLILKRLEAHRFAGLHKFGTPTAAPPNYVKEFSAPLTLFEGMNGSGKTSLANAIWPAAGSVDAQLS